MEKVMKIKKKRERRRCVQTLDWSTTLDKPIKLNVHKKHIHEAQSVKFKGGKISTVLALHQQWPSQTGSNVCLQGRAGRAKQGKNQDDYFVLAWLLRHTPRKTKTRSKQAQLVCLCLESSLNCCFAASPTYPCCFRMPHASCPVVSTSCWPTWQWTQGLLVRVDGNKKLGIFPQSD